MVDKLSVAQAGRLGGIKKWSKITKKSRSEIMRKVAQARWKKRTDYPKGWIQESS